MNKKQKIILTAAAIVIISTLMFPPFHLKTQSRVYNHGYNFILNPPTAASTVNTGTLLTQWVGVLLLTGLAWFLAKNTATSVANHREAGTNKTFNPIAPRPWNRLWARFIDYTLFLVFFYASLVFVALHGLPLTFFDNALIETLASFVISIALLILYEAAWISTFGTTPGKALFSIKILTNFDYNLSFKQALRRAFSVLASGFAFLVLFPIIPMFAMWESYKAIKNTGVAKWDKAEKHQVIHKPMGSIRLHFGVAIGIISVIILSSVHIVAGQLNKELIKKQLRQEYLPTKQRSAPSSEYNPDDEWEVIDLYAK